MRNAAILSNLPSNPVGSARPSEEAPLPVAGWTPFTTIDYPGKLAAVAYTQGCAWRCRYCHNAHLRRFSPDLQGLGWKRFEDFIASRREYLDAVVFCGGEPTAHTGLASAMQKIKRFGLLVGLHTAGMYPEALSGVLALCDWVGMDIKAPFEKYEKVTGIEGSGEKARASAQVLLASGKPYEFRTTVHPELLDREDLVEMADSLTALGAKHYVIQRFRPVGCADAGLNASAYVEAAYWYDLQSALSGRFEHFQIRG